MAITTKPFDIITAQGGALNIWTRSGLPVFFGGYYPDADDPNEAVAVWVDGQPANYPVTGRKNGQTNDPLDLLFQYQDAAKYINIYQQSGSFLTYLEPTYDSLQSAQNFGQNNPNYYDSIPIAIPVVDNIPDAPSN